MTIETEMAETWLSAGEIQELARAMEKKYQFYLNGRTFAIACERRETAAYVTTTLKNKSETFVYPVEGRILPAEEGLAARKAALFLVDYIDSYYEDYFESDHTLFLPIDWQPMTYEATDFQLKGQVINLKAERLADELLAGGKPYEGEQVII